MKIGEPREEGKSFKKREYFDLKSETSLVVRILPALGELAEKGIWNKYYAVHFGYRGTDNKMLMFQSTYERDFDTGVVITPDAAVDRIEKMRQDEKKLVEALETATAATRPALSGKLKSIQEDLRRYNVSKKRYMNVITLDGKIGVLSLGKRDFDFLKEAMDELKKDEGIIANGISGGIFLKLSKTGRGASTITKVAPYRENGQYRVLPVDDALVSRLKEEASDLNKLYPTVTPEQVERMVKGGASAVDEVRQEVYPNRSKGSSSASQEVPSSNEAATATAEQSPAPVEEPEQSSEDILASLGID